MSAGQAFWVVWPVIGVAIGLATAVWLVIVWRDRTATAVAMRSAAAILAGIGAYAIAVHASFRLFESWIGDCVTRVGSPSACDPGLFGYFGLFTVPAPIFAASLVGAAFLVASVVSLLTTRLRHQVV